MIYSKFRAWDGQSIMFYSKEIENELFFVIPGDEDFRYSASYIFCDKDWAVMQSTGLKDSNGKEVYEGDICSDGQLIIIVKFAVDPINEKFGFYVECLGGQDYNLNIGCVVAGKQIGNIYEHTNYLKNSFDQQHTI